MVTWRRRRAGRRRSRGRSELMLVVKDVLVDEAVGVVVEPMLVVTDVLVDRRRRTKLKD